MDKFIIINNIESVDKSIANAAKVVAIGNFDGVHIAHQEIIKLTVKIAKDCNLTPTVLTFSPHPKEFFSPQNFKRIESEETTYNKLAALGIKIIYSLAFDQEFADQNPADFISLLSVKMKAKHILTGYNFKFGKNRAGDINYLRNHLQKNRIKLSVTEKIIVDHQPVSSSYIKKLIENSCFLRIKSLLGHYYQIHRTDCDTLRQANASEIKFSLRNNTLAQPRPGVYFSRLQYNNKGSEIAILEISLDSNQSPDFKLYNPQAKLSADNLELVEIIDFIRPLRVLNNQEQSDAQKEIDSRILTYLKTAILK